MEYDIIQDILTKKRNRPYLKNKERYVIKNVLGIVIHWTANEHPKATAKRNRDYFNNTNKAYASTHFIVDENEIIQCLPVEGLNGSKITEVGYHVGDKNIYFEETELSKRFKTKYRNANYFLIGIEMCVNRGANFAETERKTIALTKYLIHKLGLTIDDIVRHYDVTGKLCPRMYLESKDWSMFKESVSSVEIEDIANVLPFEQQETTVLFNVVIIVDELNVRTGPNTRYSIDSVLKKGEGSEVYEILNNWYRIGANTWISGHKKYVKNIKGSQ